MKLLIGYGNPLCGDDGVGPWVARKLENCGARVLVVRQLTPELAESVAEADEVVFVDARADLAPGEIAWQTLEPRGPFGALRHHMDPRQLLVLAQQVYGRAPSAVLVGIGAKSLELGEGLTPEVERAARQVLTRLGLRGDCPPS